MNGINKVIIVGHVGNLSRANSKTPIVNATIATTDKWKDKDGNLQSLTEWHQVTFYNRLAEICAQYVNKGTLLFIEGRLKTEKYDKEGVQCYSTKIVVHNFQIMSKKRSENEDKHFEDENFSDDIPF